jgi:hypothetical protein
MRIGVVLAGAAGTPSPASYCFPALSVGHHSALRSMNARQADDARLSQTANSCQVHADPLEVARHAVETVLNRGL